MNKRRSKGVRRAPPANVGDRIIAGLADLRDTLRDGVPLERRFTSQPLMLTDRP